MEGNGTKSGGVREDGFVSWGWTPLDTLPNSPMAAASGGAVSLARPSSVTVTHELSAADARLRGELTVAIKKGNVDTMKGLVERGAPLEAACDLGYGSRGNIIDRACVSEQPKMALALLKEADKQKIGDTLAVEAKAAFFWSVSQGFTEVVKELLRRGADVGQLPPIRNSPDAESALMIAVVGSRQEEVRELLRYGAWDREPEERRLKLLSLAGRRKLIAEAFHEVGIGNFETYLAPPPLPHQGNGIWEPDYPPPPATPWNTPFNGTADGQW